MQNKFSDVNFKIDRIVSEGWDVLFFRQWYLIQKEREGLQLVDRKNRGIGIERYWYFFLLLINFILKRIYLGFSLEVKYYY